MSKYFVGFWNVSVILTYISLLCAVGLTMGIITGFNSSVLMLAVITVVLAMEK